MTWRVLGAALCALAVAVVSGCDDSPTGPSPTALIGVWGGDHVNLTVGATSSHLEFDCAHADIPGPLVADATGSFAAAGTFVREAGPIREGDMPDPRAAMYVGTVSASTMRLTVRVTATNETTGPFVLTRGTSSRLLKCL